MIHGFTQVDPVSLEAASPAKLRRIGNFSGELVPACCPLCPEAPYRKVYEGRDGIGFHLCISCNLLFASPRFAEASLLSIYEEPTYLSRSFRPDWDYEAWSRSNSRAYQHALLKVRLFRQYLSPGQRLLDVGCGPGLTVAEAVHQGLDCEGIDPSSMLTALGRQRFGVRLHQALAEEFRPARLYHGVVIWDVLEHVYDPLRVLRHCREFLLPEGHIFIQTPNHRGLSNRLKSVLAGVRLRRSFSHFGFPWHVYAFDRNSLHRMLAAAGFEGRHFESWPATLKSGRNPVLLRPFNFLLRRLCLGDYIMVVGVRK